MSIVKELCNEIIERCFDIDKCIDSLEELKNLVKNAENKKKLIKEASETFNQFLLMRFSTFLTQSEGRHKNYKYISPDESIGVLVSSLMARVGQDVSYFSIMVDAVLLQLKGYVSSYPGCGELISEETVDSIMNLPVAMGTSLLLSRKGFIKILNLDYMCNYSSAPLSYMGMVLDLRSMGIIINSRSNPQSGNKNYPDYLFMHELGHLFNMYLSKGTNEIPSSFKAVINNAFEKEKRNIPLGSLSEVFADCFTIACANKTKYEKTNPFIPLFKHKNCECIATYMIALVEKEFRK